MRIVDASLDGQVLLDLGRLSQGMDGERALAHVN